MAYCQMPHPREAPWEQMPRAVDLQPVKCPGMEGMSGFDKPLPFESWN